LCGIVYAVQGYGVGLVPHAHHQQSLGGDETGGRTAQPDRAGAVRGDCQQTAAEKPTTNADGPTGKRTDIKKLYKLCIIIMVGAITPLPTHVVIDFETFLQDQDALGGQDS
jgi:hypothetical protein